MASLLHLANLNAQNYFSLTNGCIDSTSVAVAFTGETEISTCTADGTSDRIRFATSNLAMAYGYVVVDVNDIIVSIGFSNFIDFEMLPAGVLRVYAFSNFGFITAEVGEDFNTAQLSVPCFGLTTNFVTVNNASPGAPTVSTPSGETEFSTCPNDGIADIISFTSDGTLENTAFIITDDQNVVLAVNTTGSQDFDGAGTGICRVYAFSYSGDLSIMPGDDLDDIEASSGCGGLSENYITVNRQGVVGGTVETIDNETTIMTCPGDGLDDIFSFIPSGNSGSNFTFVVTDADNVILAVPDGNTVNFEGAGEGTCRVWGLAFEGELTAMAGDNAAEVDLASGCFALSDNFVTVIREVAVGGTVATVDGDTEVATCPNDNNPDLVAFASTGSSGGTFTYVITDENNIILAVPAGNEIDFENAGIGICRVWGLTYQGDLLAMEGDDAAAVQLASSCFELSDNFVTVIRSVPEGGTVATEAGETEISTCPGDGIDDIVSFVNTGSDGENFTFIVTDNQNVVLGVPMGNEINFEGAGPGVCLVFGIAYEGELLVQPGDNAGTVELASGCYSLTDNFVTVTRSGAEGGTIATDDGATEVTTCPGDGNPDIINFVTDGGSGPNFGIVITDANNVILGFPGGNSVDFDNVEPGVCRVWGISYDGDIVASPGDIATEVMLASGCSALSENFVAVNRISPEGGTVSTEDGETMVMTCPNDGVPDLIAVDSTGGSQERFTYIITDENNVILALPFGDQFNLDGAGVGVCRIWGLSYDGVVIATPGDNAAEIQLATSCFALSDNFVTVVREVPSGGTVATEAGETEIFICPGDELADVVRFDSAGVDGGAFTYVVTDENNIILGVPGTDAVDFESAGLGICRLWGLVYQGDLLAMAGDDAANTQLSDGCFSLSDNFVTVNRQDVVGGTVSTNTGTTEVTTCPGDGIADLVGVMSSDATGPNFTYVITDDNNVILDVTSNDEIDFEGAGEGVCRVWGLAYAGDITAEAGQNAAEVALASGCFALSDNFITVIRTSPEGGSISTIDGGEEFDVCSGDNTPDVFTFSSPGSSDGNYVYIVTQDNFVLSELPSNSFDFNNAVSGTYMVYGLAYAGTLSIIPGDNILESQLATSCFDLTDNFITINIEQVDGCEVSAVGTVGNFVYLCPQNPNDGFVEFVNCSSSNAPYQYVITSPADVILFEMDSASFDFGALPLPEVRIYGISYTGTLNSPLVGTSITDDMLSDRCFSVSDNYITVINAQPEAGIISLAEGTADPFCVANGNGIVEVETTSTSAAGYVILVTDENNIVLDISSTSVDVSDLAPGNYRFWGLSYTGNITVEVGDDAALVALADNCFELTADFLPFQRGEDINGGIISLSTGLDTAYTCPMDGMPDLLIVNTTQTGVPYRFLVTDELGNILIPNIISNIIDFDPAQAGICRVYGYAFSGNVTASFGQNVATAMLSDSCFALSENFITVIRQSPDGGMVTLAADSTTTEVTIDLGSENTTVEVTNNSTANLISYTYVITDDNNIILGMGDGPSFDFADAGVGVCRIWGLSYQGDILAQVGDDAATTVLASSCFELSEQFVQVNRVDEEGIQDEETPETADALSLTPYPNPVSGSELQVVIESETPLAAGQAYVRDMNGRAWAVNNVPGGTNRAVVNFDISQLPNGLFTVQYRAGDRQEIVRFIRQ